MRFELMYESFFKIIQGRYLYSLRRTAILSLLCPTNSFFKTSNAFTSTVNENFEVIRPSGEPIKNLYAIGEVIGFGATSGNAYVNGMGVTPALTYGRLLGQRI